MTYIEGLRERGVAIEKQAYFPPGADTDGAPYTADLEHLPFIEEVRKLVGGQEALEQKIIDMGGDPHCGNWWLVAAFKIAGVQLQKEPRGYRK